MTIKVEMPESPDLKRLAALYAQCFEHTRGWGEDDFEAMLLATGVVALVADDYQGFGMIRCIAGDAEILTLAVPSSQRRKGRGEAIVSAMCAWARKQGAGSISLEVRPSNSAALSLYGKMGFRTLSRVRGDYYQNSDGSYEDALTLQLALK